MMMRRVSAENKKAVLFWITTCPLVRVLTWRSKVRANAKWKAAVKSLASEWDVVAVVVAVAAGEVEAEVEKGERRRRRVPKWSGNGPVKRPTLTSTAMKN